MTSLYHKIQTKRAKEKKEKRCDYVHVGRPRPTPTVDARRDDDIGMNASTSSKTSIATGTSISIDGGGGSGGSTSGRITSDAVTPTSSRTGSEKYLDQRLAGSRSSSLWAALWSDVEARDEDALPPPPLSMSLGSAADGLLRLGLLVALLISCWMSSGRCSSFLGLMNMRIGSECSVQSTPCALRVPSSSPRHACSAHSLLGSLQSWS